MAKQRTSAPDMSDLSKDAKLRRLRLVKTCIDSKNKQ